MVTQLKGKHFLSTDHWTKQELDTVFETAFDLKRKFALGESTRYLQDKTLFMMFFEQSTRTRNSMEAGMTQLGGHAHDLTPDKMQLSHGESAKDTAIILSRMGHGIASRNCFYGIGKDYLAEMAKYSTRPVMSLQDDVYHPFQGLADLMTIFEYFGKKSERTKSYRFMGLRRYACQTSFRSADTSIALSPLRNRFDNRTSEGVSVERLYRREGKEKCRTRRRFA